MSVNIFLLLLLNFVAFYYDVPFLRFVAISFDVFLSLVLIIALIISYSEDND